MCITVTGATPILGAKLVSHSAEGRDDHRIAYELITSIGDLLTKFMEEREKVSNRDFEIIRAHVDAMHAVIRQDIKGNGGKIGTQIVEELSQLVVRGT